MKLIRTEDDYRQALASIQDLMVLDPPADTPEGVLLDALVDEVIAYEEMCEGWTCGTDDAEADEGGEA